MFTHNSWAWTFKSRQCQINFVWKKHLTHSPLVVGILINDPFQGIVSSWVHSRRKLVDRSALTTYLARVSHFPVKRRWLNFHPPLLWGEFVPSPSSASDWYWFIPPHICLLSIEVKWRNTWMFINSCHTSILVQNTQ